MAVHECRGIGVRQRRTSTARAVLDSAIPCWGTWTQRRTVFARVPTLDALEGDLPVRSILLLFIILAALFVRSYSCNVPVLGNTKIIRTVLM